MLQKSSPSFWIPGGVFLLIFCGLIAPLQSFAARHVHSDSAQHLLLVVIWILRAVAVAGIVCIVIGLVISPLFYRTKQNEKDRHETQAY